MKRVADLTLRLVVRMPKGGTRDLTVTSPADLPAKVAVAAIAEAIGLDPTGCEAIRLASGARLGGDPLGSLGLRQGDEVMIRELPSNGSAHAAGPLVELAIQEPDSPARTLALPAGEHVLGRGDRVGAEFHDSTVSRVHASVSVSHDRIAMTDRGSANGTLIDGTALVPNVATPVSLPAVLTLGRTVVRVSWRSGVADPSSVSQGTVEVANECGEVPFNRPPRLPVPLPAHTLNVEAPPADPQKGRIPIATSVVPVLIAVPMALALGNPTFLLFGLMSPAIALASFWEERHRGASSFEEQSQKFRSTLESAVRRAGELRVAETERRLSDEPGPSDIGEWAGRRSSRLWERRPEDVDFLRLRVGLGDEPSLIRLEVASGGNAQLQSWAREYVEANSTAKNVPISIDLGTEGSVGIVGPDAQVQSLARWLVAQSAALQSPRDLAIAALASERGAQTWDWLKWLPQTRPGGSPLRSLSLAGPSRVFDLVKDLGQLQSSRVGTAGGAQLHGTRQAKRPWVLLLVDGAAPVDRAAVAPILASGLDAGVVTIWMAARAEEVPGDCRTLIRVDAQGNASIATRGGQARGGVKADGLGADAARAIALSLAPLSDVSAELASGGLPERVGLLETLEAPDGAIDDWVRSSWRAKGDSLSVPIGATPDGCLTFDIQRDGLHGLIAGTTGAGKSELLQTLVAALAATYPPSRVTFLLVDYKGGTGFGRCEDLPHTVGYVTDLSAGMAGRALISLKAEIKRREAILALAKVADFKTLRREAADCPPSLLIVVDEYASLLREEPEFVTGVVDVARLGRALGVHLILGTQSPAGVVTQQIQANIGFRIALRTANVDESSLVIDSTVAAAISPETPGRAWIKLPSGELRAFQAAYANTRRSADATSSVIVREFGFRGGIKGQMKPEVQSATTDLAAIADAARRVFTTSGEPAPDKPWLPPMPEVIRASELEAPGLTVPLGLVDEADRQRQVPAVLDLEAMGGLIVYGAAQSGKTTLLRTAAAGLADRMGPADLHIYGLDFGAGSLQMLEALPQCGGIIPGEDLERSVRLLKLIRTEIDVRKSLAARDAAERPPRIVVAIDSYEGFDAVFKKVAYAEWIDGLTRLVADGRAVGVHFLVAASRRYGIPTQITSTLEQRIVLRQADADDYMQLGVHLNSREVPALPPGRGFTVASELVQCAVIGGSEEVEQAQAIRQVGARAHERFVAAHVPAIGRLAANVEASALPAVQDDGGLLLGIADSTLDPIGVRADDGHFLVAGPARTGRTTALTTIVGSIQRGQVGWPIHFLAPRDAPKGLSEDSVDRLIVGTDECAEYLQNHEWEEASNGGSRLVLVIDDAEELAEQLDAPDLLKLLRRRSSGLWIVLAAENDRGLSWHEGFKAIRKHRHGLLLRPDVNADGDILGARLPRFSAVPDNVGRGYLVRGEELDLIQVAK